MGDQRIEPGKCPSEAWEPKVGERVMVGLAEGSVVDVHMNEIQIDFDASEPWIDRRHVRRCPETPSAQVKAEAPNFDSGTGNERQLSERRESPYGLELSSGKDCPLCRGGLNEWGHTQPGHAVQSELAALRKVAEAAKAFWRVNLNVYQGHGRCAEETAAIEALDSVMREWNRMAKAKGEP